MLQLKAGRYLGHNKRSWDANGVFVSETAYHSKVFEGWHYHENTHITLILQGGNREQRRDMEIYYQLEIDKMKEIDRWLEQYRRIWEGRFETCHQHFAERTFGKTIK